MTVTGARSLMRFGLFALVAPLILAVGGRASPMPGYRLVQPGVLTVATYGSAAPALVVLPNDQLGALDGAWLTAFAKDHGLRLKLYQTTFASVILAVEQGKADVGTYYYYKEDRAKQVYYTYPFFQERATVFTQRSFPYRGPESLTGKRVGTVIGFVWAQYLQKAFGANAALFPDGTAGETALLNGQIDGWVNSDDSINDPVLGAARDKIAAHLLKAGDFGFPDSVISTLAYNFVKCDNRGLAAALDDEMTALHKTARWVGVLKENKLTETNDVPLQEPAQLCSPK
jgi:polar amino acid transport system substrate-binding protein